MAGLDPPLQHARVCGRGESLRSLTLAGWVAASRAAMVNCYSYPCSTITSSNGLRGEGSAGSVA